MVSHFGLQGGQPVLNEYAAKKYIDLYTSANVLPKEEVIAELITHRGEVVEFSTAILALPIEMFKAMLYWVVYCTLLRPWCFAPVAAPIGAFLRFERRDLFGRAPVLLPTVPHKRGGAELGDPLRHCCPIGGPLEPALGHLNNIGLQPKVHSTSRTPLCVPALPTVGSIVSKGQERALPKVPSAVRVRSPIGHAPAR